MPPFAVKPPTAYQYHPVAAYQRPMEIASYSLTTDRQPDLTHRLRHLKYYHPPSPSELPIELSDGYPDRYVEREPNQEEKLDSLLKCLRHDRIPILEDESGIDVVTWRGLMTLLMLTPYEARKGWRVCVTRYRRVLFLHQPTAFKEEERNPETPSRPLAISAHEMSYWGYRFENVSFLAQPASALSPAALLKAKADRLKAPVDTRTEYCSVVRTRLGRLGLVLGAEVDGTRYPLTPHDPNRHYVELKTHRLPQNEQHWRSFERFKLLKTFIQSYLAGIPWLIFGYRDDRGRLVRVEEMETLSVPRRVRSKGYWDPNVCLNFGLELLTWVKQTMMEADEEVVHVLLFDAERRELRLTPVQDPSDAFVVLPEWYKRSEDENEEEATEDENTD